MPRSPSPDKLRLAVEAHSWDKENDRKRLHSPRLDLKIGKSKKITAVEKDSTVPADNISNRSLTSYLGRVGFNNCEGTPGKVDIITPYEFSPDEKKEHLFYHKITETRDKNLEFENRIANPLNKIYKAVTAEFKVGDLVEYCYDTLEVSRGDYGGLVKPFRKLSPAKLWKTCRVEHVWADGTLDLGDPLDSDSSNKRNFFAQKAAADKVKKTKTSTNTNSSSCSSIRSPLLRPSNKNFFTSPQSFKPGEIVEYYVDQWHITAIRDMHNCGWIQCRVVRVMEDGKLRLEDETGAFSFDSDVEPDVNSVRKRRPSLTIVNKKNAKIDNKKYFAKSKHARELLVENAKKTVAGKNVTNNKNAREKKKQPKKKVQKGVIKPGKKGGKATWKKGGGEKNL